MDNLPTLIKEATTALHPQKVCTRCGKPVSLYNKSGLCQTCRTRKKNYSQGRKCSKCGSAITNRNGSGLCRSCAYRINAFSLGKKCKYCPTKIRDCNKSGLCQKCRKTHYLERDNSKYPYYKAWRSVKKEHKQRQRTEEMGKCRKCKKAFPLEIWQHSTLHWCPECRKGEDYQGYASYEHRGFRYGVY